MTLLTPPQQIWGPFADRAYNMEGIAERGLAHSITAADRAAVGMQLATFSQTPASSGSAGNYLLHLMQGQDPSGPVFIAGAPFPTIAWVAFNKVINRGGAWSEALKALAAANATADKPLTQLSKGYGMAPGDLEGTLSLQLLFEAWARQALKKYDTLEFRWTAFDGREHAYVVAGPVRYAWARNVMGLSETDAQLYAKLGGIEGLIGLSQAFAHLIPPQIRPPKGIAATRAMAPLLKGHYSTATTTRPTAVSARSGTPDIAGDIVATHRMLGAAAFGAGAGYAGYKIAPPKYRVAAAAIAGVIGFVTTEFILTPKQA